MKTVTYPVAMPEDLYGEIKRTADETRLSMADAIRQGLKLGLPALREKLSTPGELKPFTKEECRQAWEVPNAEFDALEHYCANLVPPPLEEDD